jgi:anaerobic ribonucleoside-triphosphate reductase
MLSTLLQNDVMSLINEMDDLISFVESTFTDDELLAYIKEYKTCHIEIVMTPINYRFCCEKKMSVNSNNSELVCQVCGRSKRYRELVFDKNQMMGYDRYKGK